MKVKHDFVTNSSTSCYLVYVPDAYKVTILELQNIHKNGAVDLYDDLDDELKAESITDEMWSKWEEELNKIIDDLKKGEGFDYESLHYGYDSSVRAFTHEVIGKFTISSVDVGGGNSSIIVPISKSDLQKINKLEAEYENKIGLCNKQL